jgi:GMP synthase-like glutamine amidotransferase
MRIACVTHVPFEGPDSIAEWADLRGHTLRRIAAVTEAWPEAGDFDMLVVMGGPMGVYDVVENPWLVSERAFLTSAIEAGKLVLGVCLGSQMLADALGGSVHAGESKEIGWFPVHRTETGDASALFSAWPDESVVAHWHGDTFELPPPMLPALSSALTPNQAFEALDGRVVGLQFHLEWTPGSLATLIDECGDEIREGGSWVQSAEELLADPARFERSRELLFEFLDRFGGRL